MYICVLAALKWKHCDAIHDTQALKLATDNTGEMGNHKAVDSLQQPTRGIL